MATPGPNGQGKKTTLDGTEAGNGAGAPSRWSKEVGKVIVDVIANGNTYAAAAAVVGIDDSTIRKWKRRGRVAIDEGRDDDELARFVTNLTRAEADAEIRLVEVIRKAATGLDATKVRKRTRPVIVAGQPVMVVDANKNPVFDADGNVQYVTIEETEIERAESKDWRAAAFLLAVRIPAVYANRLHVKGSVDHNHTIMSDEDQAIATRIASSRLGEPSRN